MDKLRNRLLIGLGLGVLVAAALALWSDLSKLEKLLSDFPWGFFVLALGCTLFNYILRFVKWHYYIRRIGARNLPPADSARLFVAGFPLAVTPGKVGEALKALWLSEWSGIPFSRGLPVVLAERFSDGLAVLILSAFGIFSVPSLGPAFLAVLAGSLAVIALSQIRPLARAILDRMERLPVVGKRIHPLREFYEAGYLLLQPGPLLFAVGIGTLSWLGEGVGFFLILIGLGLPASGATFASAVFSLAVSTLAGSLSALPGGLGAAEASITALLLLTATADHAEAGAATLLIRLATLWFGVALGLAAWSITPRLWKRTTNDGRQAMADDLTQNDSGGRGQPV
ncbi:MAG: flippase-like domain-containing protein [Anaerolineales bacterium]|nr:flippase-like domain-containing protein [Anaerolineales bacterium]